MSVSVRTDRSVDTADLAGTEPLLAPGLGRRETTCRDPHFETQRCYTFDSRVYLSYDAPADARSSVRVELSGRNEWWVFGWSGNDHRG